MAAYLIFRARERVAYLLADLTEAVRRDSLTGLLNRRGFHEAFDLEELRRGAGGQFDERVVQALLRIA